jgi:hypothetical protein
MNQTEVNAIRANNAERWLTEPTESEVEEDNNAEENSPWAKLLSGDYKEDDYFVLNEPS